MHTLAVVCLNQDETTLMSPEIRSNFLKSQLSVLLYRESERERERERERCLAPAWQTIQDYAYYDILSNSIYNQESGIHV